MYIIVIHNIIYIYIYIYIYISGLNLAHFTLSRDNQIIIFIISRQSNPKFHYLDTFEIMKVHNKYYIICILIYFNKHFYYAIGLSIVPFSVAPSSMEYHTHLMCNNLK